MLRRAALTMTLLLALFAIVTGALATLRLHSRFAVNRVVLEGVPESRRAEVEELTDAWIGRPLLFVDLDRPVAALKARSWVLQAAARRIVPDTVEVRIRANPAVALTRKKGELHTVDRGGNLLGSYSGRSIGKQDDFVLIDPSGAKGEESAALARGAAFLERLRAEDPALLARVSELEVTDDGFALVDQVTRVRLLFGRDAAEPGRAAAIWRAYLALRPELERHSLTGPEADLRFDDQIVLKAPVEDGRGKT